MSQEKPPVPSGRRRGGLLPNARDIKAWEEGGGRGLRGFLRRTIRAYLRWNRALLLDPWIRYRPAVQLLEGQTGDLQRTLDVGSGENGLARFLGREVVGVDLDFPATVRWSNHPATLLRAIRATATALPFRDGAFDTVVSMDMIEHLPTGERPKALREMLRVARRTAIVGFPYGRRSREFDRSALAVERDRGIELGWRQEHVLRGTPGEEFHDEIIRTVGAVRPEMTLSWFGHEGMRGLRLRWRLQFLISKDSRLYGLVFFPLYRLHSRGRPKHGYRRIYVFKKAAGGKPGDRVRRPARNSVRDPD
ncbi:MAG: methyltransferase domain-containing protein [Methanobacteriota archaeon]|nr:MAG: methyltransferase domain-containing protein [Euryarchaeota archaeon]